MSNQRIAYLDAVKFITIYLVVLGHYYQFFPSGNIGEITRDIIYSFHMPLFMMISGFFSLSSFNKPFIPFLWKKIKTLLIPVLSWTIIITVYNYCLGHSTETIVTEIKGNSWFLKTLFACYVVVYFLKLTKWPDYLICLISVIVFCLIPRGSTFQFNWMYMFFWMGYFARKYQNKFSGRSVSLLILAVTLFLVGLYLMVQYNVTQVILISPKSLANDLANILIRTMVSIGGSLSLILLVKMVYEKYYDDRATKLSSWGQYTLGIYVMQTLLIQYILRDFCTIGEIGAIPPTWRR